MYESKQEVTKTVNNGGNCTTSVSSPFDEIRPAEYVGRLRDRNDILHYCTLQLGFSK